MLLRRQVPIRKIARIPGRNLIVVADVVDKVNRSESLLRQRDAIHRATDPHDPCNLERLREGPVATRIFRIDDDEMDNAVVILRVIYDMREVTELDEENSVSVRDAQTILAASEALLRELGLLVEAGKEPGDS